jgi:hypothetical protein
MGPEYSAVYLLDIQFSPIVEETATTAIDFGRALSYTQSMDYNYRKCNHKFEPRYAFHLFNHIQCIPFKKNTFDEKLIAFSN